MAEAQPQTKRTYTTDLPAWLIVLIIAAGVAGYFLNAFLDRRQNAKSHALSAAEHLPYVIYCVVGSTDEEPDFAVQSPGGLDRFATSGTQNQLVFGETREGERVVLFTVETKPGGANGCGVLIITGEQEVFVDWVSDLDHHSPRQRRRDTRVHSTGTTEWDVPCRVSDD